MTSLDWWKTKDPGADAALPAFPTLDDAWRWYLIGRARAKGPLPEALEAMCHYAEDVRQGRWPDSVSPEVAVQSVYLALAQATLGLRVDRAAFEHDVTQLFDAVVAHLEAGGSVVAQPFLASHPAVQKHVAALREDHRLFKEDLKRGEKYDVTLPAQASATRAPRSVRLLVLHRPASTQFKLWARREEDCALLLVELPDGGVVLSVDPARKLVLDWLAPRLSEAEGAAWYGGDRHDGTLIAAPKAGTRLGVEGVLRVMARHARVARRRPTTGVGVVAAALMLVLVVLIVRAPKEAAPGEVAVSPSAAQVALGAKGVPIPPAQVVDLLSALDGPKSYEGYALVAGVCGYSGDRSLKAPCEDARAMRDLLVSRLGYRRDHILFLVDQPREGEATDGVPTARNLKLAVERFRSTFPSADETSRFVLYYSGHGGYEKGARKDFGVLQPSGFFDDEAAPLSERGWDMQELLDDVRKGVPSRHVMVLLDACYAGWAAGAKGDEALRPELRTLWKERAEVVLSAGTRGQRAWEDEADVKAQAWGGHSAMTAFLLEGLGRSGAPRADANADGVVTDEELAAFVRAGVPPAVAELKKAQQTPQFFRFDGHLPQSGQFLFIPEPVR